MKKYIAKNRETGETCFCKYQLLEDGVLKVEYFVPLVGFSYKVNPSKWIRSIGRRTTKDGRKSVVTYLIHPSLWCGEDFYHIASGISVRSAIDKCFESITLDYYGSHSI